MSHIDYIEENLEPEYINHEEIRKSELIDQVEKLTKQLEIAVACLKHYADENFYLFPTYRNGHERAEKALQQIKELEK